MGSAAGYGIQGVASLGSAYAESESIKAQGDYQRSISEMNSEFANAQANDATKRGEQSVNDLRQQTRQRVGSQRAALAASGVDVGSGSAAQLQMDTEMTAIQDARTIRNNAVREAWGFRSQAANMSAQGDFASITARGQSTQTLLNGGMRAAGNFSSAYGAYKDGKKVDQPTRKKDDWF